MQTILPDHSAIVEHLRPIFPQPPEISIVLGSGLGTFAERLEGMQRLVTVDIPGFPRSTVEGHKGVIVSGRLAGKRILCFQGRIHLYEGYSVEEVILPIQVAFELGAKVLILTNAAGGINPHLKPGSLMLVTDQIDFQFRVKIQSEAARVQKSLTIERPPIFNSQSLYSDRLREIARAAALHENVELYPGVLGAILGPCYETPAEVRMQMIMGMDAVCMSTVAEAAEGVRLGLEVLGISCITNRAAGLKDSPLDHNEVIEVAAEVEDKFVRLLREIIRRV